MTSPSMEVEVIGTNADTYKSVCEAIGHSKKDTVQFDIRILRTPYNQAAVRSVLLVSCSTRKWNIARSLQRYGLIEGVDFSLIRTTRDHDGNRIPANETVYAITKLSTANLAPK